MMKNIVNKLVLGVLITLGALLSGQMLPPPPPPQEEAGGPGTPAPVDMYVIFLAIIAVMFIVYFVRQYNNKKVA